MDNEQKNTPAISVIIPMYNVEKYVGECLDSLLAQTFQDFEVIVVDDKSSDNSPEIVDGYKERFSGRLKLIRSQKNSGGCAVPRNIGFGFAHGKYIFFLDADDLITKTAFEELYKIAEDFQADVVHCEQRYDFFDSTKDFSKLKPKTFQRGKLVTKPTLETDDITKRISDFHEVRYLWYAWNKLIRREFLTENHIENPEVTNIEDMLFTCYLVACADRYVRVPNIVNFYRKRPGSITFERLEAEKHVRRWLRALINGFDHAEKFFNGRKFFRENPIVKFLALDSFINYCTNYFKEIYTNYSPVEFDEIIREEFANAKNPLGLHAFIFAMMNVYRQTILRLHPEAISG